MAPDNHNDSWTNLDGWSKNIEMDDIDSSGSSLDRSWSQAQTPTQADFSCNPPLDLF
ncbi:hypothetical protein PGT21_036191 [Puccinia graminis f. sp. tritici]|uniref:Uncharacterized protein n=1 Tax=Puccinia graminis f. sp. tritici TaxID=56615 RepID=A0A5B0MJ61_PUCGR|nr:hypothetical protein PGTUg99_037401 [Puccinia graminis f. sp. tritici]KAA1091607.1 hypothetical protein PGT21_036191 [Puccinia graminis f. sp. tritici]